LKIFAGQNKAIFRNLLV